MPVNSFENYPMSWRPKLSRENTPLYLSIAAALEKDIAAGNLQPNDKLPPQRELADYLDVNLSTVTRAFKLCESKGLISGTIGKGTYVASDVSANLPMLSENKESNCINLGASHPLYQQNRYITQMLKKLPSRINIDNLLKYTDISGSELQKESACIWLHKLGIPAQSKNILITSGLQNSLTVILASLFRYGDKIATNSLTYPGIKNIANMLGIILIPIPYRNRKMDLKYLEQICKTENIKGIYVIPDSHNPTTVTMELNERIHLSSMIEKYALINIEDGTYTFLSEKPNLSLYELIPDHTIHICTLSNSLSAGLRISFLAAPLAFRESLLTGIRNINVMSSPIETELAAQLIQTGIAQRITSDKIPEIIKRNRITENLLAGNDLWGSQRSQFRWLILRNSINSHELEIYLRKKGVQVFCSERFLVGNSTLIPAIRLAVCSPDSHADLARGLQIINESLLSFAPASV
ncbi:PLP-dependent aminotransferase family protein [uncultured Robinsoniella sp.]|uniref:aminotransferase-like domain-containing protein n=1 Tax=uncultured Robinsoniella sp. TaxID=904190 RepID=UPI00374F00B6